MMKTRTLLLFAALALCVSMRAQTFTLGADISWETEMLAKGYTFANAKGESRECAALMRELGLNAIRLRVWVNPSDGYCNKDDVLAKAREMYEE